MNHSDLNGLLVVHRPKDNKGRGMDAARILWFEHRGLIIDTCLRQVAVLSQTAEASELPLDKRSKILHGRDAYSFLLQTMTGLNSSVLGETNVQGQFRRAWEIWRNRADACDVQKLVTIMHRLQADSRQIRSLYLQGIGGNSYGTLVRKMLAPKNDAHILFVGAGELARSMIGMFSAHPVGIWNHHPVDLKQFSNQQVFGAGAAHAAASWATDVVLTTPADEHNDGIWAPLAAHHKLNVVHLGRRRADRGAWSAGYAIPEFSDLDDLFDLRNTQTSVRQLSISRARKACAQLAGHNSPVEKILGEHIAQRA